MTSLKGLLASKTAIIAIAIIAGATVLAGMGRITWEQWQEVAIWIGGTYIGGEKVRDAARELRAKGPAS